METHEEVLRRARVVAVVGLSPRPRRDSYEVAAYLQAHGYRIVPVNPAVSEVPGELRSPDLASVPQPIDVVGIFRRSDQVGPIVAQAIAVGAKAVWMQEGILNEEAARLAREAGLAVVMVRCMKKERQRLMGPKVPS